MATQIISVRPEQIANLVTRLEGLGREAPDAMVRALNRARTSVLARLLRWLVAATGIPSSRLRKSIRARGASRGQLQAVIALYGGKARLIDYDRRIQADKLPRHGFKARMPGSGHVGYFERAPGSRHRRRGEPFAPHELPIREILGPAFTSFISDVGLQDLLKFGGDRLRIELERELTFREGRRAA